MNKNLIKSLGAAVTLLVSSCAYDPYYSPGSVSGSYSTGYGHGYGYGGSSFSTSVFVGTGNSRWGYDPYCRSYYDYTRRCYYDPYLYGYYPIGYRPPVVYGVPHPYGWRSGRGNCPPPSRVTSVTISNYRDRESAYRRSNYGWANQVRQQPISAARPQTRPYSTSQSQSYSPTQRPFTRENQSDYYPSRPQLGSGADPRLGGRGFSPSRTNLPSTPAEARPRPTSDQRRPQAPPQPAEIRPIAPPDEARAPQQSMQNTAPRQQGRGGSRGQDSNPFSGGIPRTQGGRN